MPPTPACRVLSLQSEVVAGHVGHGAARPAYHSLGIELLALPTVLFSNHPGHGGFRGRSTPADQLTELLNGLEERGFLDGIDAVQSGYLGEAAHAAVVRDAVLRVRGRNPAAIYLLDPVFGDDGGAYAAPGVAEAMARDLLPLADIVTPNRFELAGLTGRPVEDLDTAVAAAGKLGRPTVLATSIPFGERVGIVLMAAGLDPVALSAPRIRHRGFGAGDLLAALFLGRRLRGEPPEAAAAAALASVAAMIREAAARGLAELPLIACRNLLSDPPRLDAS